MNSEKETDELIESIRQELNAILNENDPKGDGKVDPKTPLNLKKSPFDQPPKKTLLKNIKDSNPDEELKKFAEFNTEEFANLNLNEIMNNLSPELTKKLVTSETAKRAEFLNNRMAGSIDESLQKMKLELKESYEIFHTISTKFDSINFGLLRNRIKDLQLGNADKIDKNPTTKELKDLFEKSYAENKLDKLTANVSENFRSHPGEFADIPEVSQFFKACTQLQHRLGVLKKQQDEVQELEKRITWATEVSQERADEIRNAMTGQCPVHISNNK